jgi:iron complex outermembrane recepter protein
LKALAWGLALAAMNTAVHADDDARSLDQVVISATRVSQSSADLPVAIDSVSAQQIHEGQLQVNLSETLVAVPGVVAQNRQNYAQDLQISVRGFGARSSFGVRGVRLYADGIPGTMPDGQGQYSNFDLGSAQRIEVLRGPFSALYGNSSGGVISIFTRDAPPGAEVDATAEYGSFDTQRYAVQGLLGESNGLNAVLDAVHFSTDGFRAHSAAERNVGNLKVSLQPDSQSTLTFVANAIDAPTSQDPLGLTAAQLAANRRQAGANSIAYNTRKNVQQEQFGTDYERTLNDNDRLSATAYGGVRMTSQFQAIPTSTEAIRTSPGGVIGLWHGYWGTDLHLTDQRELAGMPLQTTLGVAYDSLEENRHGYLNFVGGVLGVQGAQRASLTNRVFDVDEYLQLQWDPVARLRLVAGVRNSVVVVNSTDHFAAANAGESGARYNNVNPVAGLTYRASSLINLYGSYGRGFETPTLDELAYRSTNGSLPGLNFGLRPARSDNYEAGIKTSSQAPFRAAFDGFYIHTVNEVAVGANAAGRSVYENIPESRRRGVEAEVQGDLGAGFSSMLAYTYIQAITMQPYTSCSVVPCVPTTVTAGSHIPAVPASTLYTNVGWKFAPAGLSLAVEAIDHTRIYANDLNTASASGYWLFNVHASLQQALRHWRLTESFRIDNLANRSYVGSVIVNETNTRFYEPEPGRAAYLMLSAAYL